MDDSARRKLIKSVIFIFIILLLLFIVFQNRNKLTFSHARAAFEMPLPHPAYDSKHAFENVLYKRRSIRQYAPTSLSLQEVSQLLWAAQGITSPNGFRTAPSAGALYPLEVYLLVGRVNDLPSGVYRYIPKTQGIERIQENDAREALAESAFEQIDVKNAAVDIVITADFKKTTKKYGARGKRYVYMEAGHAAQNIYLQAVSLGLGTVSIGAFDDKAVKILLQLPPNEHPLYIMPVGKI